MKYVEKKFCPHCGRQNPRSYNYCDECGFKIPDVCFSEHSTNPQPQIIISAATVPQHKKRTRIVTTQSKNFGIAMVLTFMFGPIGLFYSSVIGGLVMTFGPIIVYIISLVGLFSGSFDQTTAFVILCLFSPFGAIFFGLWWLISLVWTVIAISIYNKNVSVSQIYEE